MAETSSSTLPPSTTTLMVNQLLDMEWKFGVTASSDTLNHAGNSFLQLKLVLEKGTSLETVNMGMRVARKKCCSSLD
jgi:COMM domain